MATHFDTFMSRLPAYHEFFSAKTVVYLWVALGVVKVIHEFGHGLSCKRFGGEVHEMGFLFLCLSPAMYCNVSDAWTLPNKWHRIIISFAGIYVELMIAALATFVWWNTPSQPFVNNMSLSLMVVCSVSTVVFNGNPLMRLRRLLRPGRLAGNPQPARPGQPLSANRFPWNYCLGIEMQPEPYMALWPRLFVIFSRRQLHLSLGGDFRDAEVPGHVSQAVQAGGHQLAAGRVRARLDARLAARPARQERS